MPKNSSNQIATRKIVSKVLSDTTNIEMIFNQANTNTQFAIFKDKNFSIVDSYKPDTSTKYIPIPATNNLIKHQAVVFPSAPEPFFSPTVLIKRIQDHIYKYVDISEQFLKIASYYVLLTWVYDAFNELPYIRFRGDYGSGKTRALLVVGSLCNKAFFASGASTVSPIFHTLDSFRGTLVFDEADFRYSDEKSELIKIFNNGNVKGFPVLRTARTNTQEFDPRAFNVFGPKIVAMRKAFSDPALESRFLTEEMGQRSLRRDIPINLPESHNQEALDIRNQLLLYRFQTLAQIKINDNLIDPALSPRLNQILTPLLSIIDDQKLQIEIKEVVRSFDKKLSAERSSSIEADVLTAILNLFNQADKPSLSISEITSACMKEYSSVYERPITPRLIGSVLRKKLYLYTYKSHGVYVLPSSEKEKVLELCIRYGVLERDDVISEASGRHGDVGTSSAHLSE